MKNQLKYQIPVYLIYLHIYFWTSLSVSVSVSLSLSHHMILYTYATK